MDLKPVQAIFQRVVDANDRAGQFLRFANGNEAATETMRHPASKDEAARLDACNQRRAMPRDRLRQSINRFAKAVGIMHQRRDVAHMHARLRKVRNGAGRGEKIGDVKGTSTTVKAQLKEKGSR